MGTKEKGKMINTNYSSLVIKGNSSSWQTMSATKAAEVEDTSSQSNKASTFSDTGVILTLSKQTEGVRLKSTEATTYAATASSATLKVGSKGTAVYELQKNLTILGYSTNGTDGIFGNDTKNAVVAFQKAYGLTADGIVGAGTQSAIAKAIDYHNKGILTVGSRGARVTELQKNLTKLGYNTNGTDGIFGTGTQKAVILFQRDHGLKQDGMVGSDTQKAIQNALKTMESNTTNPSGNSAAIQRMLDNLKNDTSLGLSADKKAAMLVAAERLLNENYEVEFVAGVLGNIQNEGTPGKFESSYYVSSSKPPYLEYMDTHFDYQNKFSGKSIQEVGISAALELAKKAEESGYQGKFGLGMIQWTESRTIGLLESYQKYASSDKPTKEECIEAEVNFLLDELEGDYAYIYDDWKEGSRTAGSAGELVCRYYERPHDKKTQAVLRAENAQKIYDILVK